MRSAPGLHAGAGFHARWPAQFQGLLSTTNEPSTYFPSQANLTTKLVIAALLVCWRTHRDHAAPSSPPALLTPESQTGGTAHVRPGSPVTSGAAPANQNGPRCTP